VATAASVNIARLREVTVPVLIAGGDTDVAFTEDGMRRERDFFTGSDDVTVEIFENTGHFPMADLNAPVFRATLSEWLRTRRLGGGR
jgi:pimeloyl-ACP methyl ester carboxylesterase